MAGSFKFDAQRATVGEFAMITVESAAILLQTCYSIRPQALRFSMFFRQQEP
jgi:hypothetical protein